MVFPRNFVGVVGVSLRVLHRSPPRSRAASFTMTCRSKGRRARPTDGCSLRRPSRHRRSVEPRASFLPHTWPDPGRRGGGLLASIGLGGEPAFPLEFQLAVRGLALVLCWALAGSSPGASDVPRERAEALAAMVARRESEWPKQALVRWLCAELGLAPTPDAGEEREGAAPRLRGVERENGAHITNTRSSLALRNADLVDQGQCFVPLPPFGECIVTSVD